MCFPKCRISNFPGVNLNIFSKIYSRLERVVIMNNFYEEDLAYVLDTGFCDFARNAGLMILQTLNN